MGSDVITTILQQSLFLFFLFGSLFALMLGLLFLLSPQRARHFSQQNNRWLSLRRTTKPLEIPRPIDGTLYHHHRFIGLFILLCSAYVLYRFGFDYNHSRAIATLAKAGDMSQPIAAWLLESLLWFFIPISLLLLLFGAIMALKPSSLKGLEGLANRWLSTRKMSQPIEKPRYFIDHWVENRPRLFGLILSLGALYNATLLLWFLINR